MGDSKKADPALALDVDVMILEYLLYNATQALLETDYNGYVSSDSSSSCDNQLVMVDAFLSIFHDLHQNDKISPSLRFRLLLLKFTALYTRRKHHTLTSPSSTALTALRQASKTRARIWRFHAPSSAFDTSALVAFVTRIVTSRTNQGASNAQQRSSPHRSYAESEADEELPTLLDLLPLFIDLTAARAEMGDLNSGQQGGEEQGFTVTQGWMDMAAEFMHVACVEQYKVHGATTAAPVLEAFAWGLGGGASDEGRAGDGDMEMEIEVKQEQVDMEGDTRRFDWETGYYDHRTRYKTPDENSHFNSSPPQALIGHASDVNLRQDINDIFAIQQPRISSSTSIPSSPSHNHTPVSPTHDPHNLWTQLRTAALSALLDLPTRVFVQPSSYANDTSSPQVIDLDPSPSPIPDTDRDRRDGLQEESDMDETSELQEELAREPELEASVLSFLRGLLDAQPRPVLVSLGEFADSDEDDDDDDAEEGMHANVEIQVEVEGVGSVKRGELKRLWRAVVGT